jgi:hypothetical protein
MDGAIDATSASVYWWCCRCPHGILNPDAGRTVPRRNPGVNFFYCCNCNVS